MKLIWDQQTDFIILNWFSNTFLKDMWAGYDAVYSYCHNEKKKKKIELVSSLATFLLQVKISNIKKYKNVFYIS